MLTKSQKIKFVEDGKKELKAYSITGIVELNGLPDRLVQLTKNRLKPSTKFIMGRKTLLIKILEAHAHGKDMVKGITGTSAIIVSNETPFELYNRFKSNIIKLSAKPGQIAPDDVPIEAGETTIMPGQTVTELKSAGIDVQIQKGKVVIAKDKILVKKGEVINASVAKALHTLEIMPFSAVVDPLLMSDGHLVYSRNVLGINQAKTLTMIADAFRNALSVSMKGGIVNSYTINTLVANAYRNAIALGTEVNLYDSGIIEKVLAKAAMGAASIGSMVKPQQPSA